MAKQTLEDIIKELRVAKKAYSISLEYDYCPSNGDKGYKKGIDEYSGSRPDEIALMICNLIDKLPKLKK